MCPSKEATIPTRGAWIQSRASWVATGQKMQHDFEVYGSAGSLVFTQDRFNELHFYSNADPAGRRGFRRIEAAPEHEPYGLFWIEEPLPPDDLAGYLRVSRAITQRLAAGEEESTLRGFMRLIDEGGIGLAQIDVTRCGLTQAMQIAGYAASRGVAVANHNFTTDINTAASLHFLAAVPNALVLEYCVEPSEISRRLIRDPIRLEDGHMRVPDAPGFGVEPDMAVVEKYLVRD